MVKTLPFNTKKGDRIVVDNKMVKVKWCMWFIFGWLTSYEKDFFREGEF